jgi:hypothetical protein
MAGFEVALETVRWHERHALMEQKAEGENSEAVSSTKVANCDHISHSFYRTRQRRASQETIVLLCANKLRRGPKNIGRAISVLIE